MSFLDTFVTNFRGGIKQKMFLKVKLVQLSIGMAFYKAEYDHVFENSDIISG